jgi:cell division transport system ATP-binding protein
MIILRSVTKAYQTGRVALSGVTLTIPAEDFVFLVGGNGAGKSTLLKLLTRQEIATTGVVMVGGTDLRELPEHRVPAYRQNLGVVFQDIRLFPRHTIEENVAFSLRVAGMDRRTDGRDLVTDALELVGITAHAKRFPHQLSGGEQQRAAIARAIVRSPSLLLADEPTASLPPESSWQIVQLLAEINRRGVTVVIATHDREVVDRMHRRVIELEGGAVRRDDRYGRFEPGITAFPNASPRDAIGTMPRAPTLIPRVAFSARPVPRAVGAEAPASSAYTRPNRRSDGEGVRMDA